jgi:hypothetical protein
VRDVALVPEGHVLEPDERVRAHDACEAADALGDHGVALVRHGRGAFLALAEGFRDLADLRAREVADLESEPLQRGGDERKRAEQLGVAVTLHDLRRDRLRLEPEPLTGQPLELGVGRRIGADRTRELADAHRLEGMQKPLSRAVELEGPPGELEPEGRRLGVYPVCPADAEVVLVPARLDDDRAERALEL